MSNTWVQLLTSSNYYSTTDGRYYTKSQTDSSYVKSLRSSTDLVYYYRNGSESPVNIYVSNAPKWTNARTITLTGAVTGSVSIDGSANVSLNTTFNLGTLDSRYRKVGGSWKGQARGERQFGFTSNDGQGEVAFTYQAGVLDMAIDGYIYQNEGKYMVLDTNNYSSTLDSRYYTESESDSRFVNATGDTITGQLLMNSIGTGTYNGAIQIRENNKGGALNGNNNEAPRITFHWGNRHAKDFGMNRYGHPMWDGYMIWHEGNDGSGSGLDADKLDGRQLSNGNGGIPYYIEFPPYNYFGSDTDTITYFKNIIKWAYTNANYGGKTLLIGVGSPNSLGNFQIQLYGTSGVDSTTGYPKYCSGIYIPLNGLPIIFGTNNYTYYGYNIASLSSNVASATMLQSARTINGTSFNGTANITTSYWGTTRTFYINSHDSYAASAGVSVNGSGNVTLLLPNTISCSNWFRSTGTTGWYSETYKGGIYMEDSIYLRIYNAKRFFVSNTENTDYSTATAISTNGGIYAAKNITTAANVYAKGAITARQTSDLRLKTDFDTNVDYRDRLLMLGNVVDFSYNEFAIKRGKGAVDSLRHTSVIYQNALKANITGMCIEEDDGYGCINPISPDLIFTIVGAVQANILSIRSIESRTDRLERELREAKEEISRLRKLLPC